MQLEWMGGSKLLNQRYLAMILPGELSPWRSQSLSSLQSGWLKLSPCTRQLRLRPLAVAADCAEVVTGWVELVVVTVVAVSETEVAMMLDRTQRNKQR